MKILCKCGCKQLTSGRFKRGSKELVEYVSGHNSFVENPFKGKKHNTESKKKMSNKKIGYTPWNKDKQGLQAAWNKGIPNFNIRNENHPMWKGGKPKCLDCGKQLESRYATYCRRHMLLGERNSNWQGGKTLELKKIRNSLEYSLWRTKVFERDNYTCTECGAKNGKGKATYLEADHIKQFAFYPELRLEPDNGRTLCRNCHQKTDTYGRGAILYQNSIKQEREFI